MVSVILSNGYVRDLKVPEGASLADVQRHLVEEPQVWPEDANQPGWFYNPTHVIAIREYD